MLKNFNSAEKIYIATGYTDLRRGIDGLASIIQSEFELNPMDNCLFLFCGRRLDRRSENEVREAPLGDQAALLGRKRLCIALQTPRIREIPVAT